MKKFIAVSLLLAGCASTTSKPAEVPALSDLFDQCIAATNQIVQVSKCATDVYAQYGYDWKGSGEGPYYQDFFKRTDDLGIAVFYGKTTEQTAREDAKKYLYELTAKAVRSSNNQYVSPRPVSCTFKQEGGKVQQVCS